MSKFKKLLISLIALAVLIIPVSATYQTFYDFVYMGASGLSIVDNSGSNVVFQMQTSGDFDMYGTETIRGDSPADGIKDLLNFSSVDNAVTNLTIANAVTGSNAVIGVESTDADTGITVSPKGTGKFKINSDIDLETGSVDVDVIDNNASAVSFDSSGSVGILEVDTTTGTVGVKVGGYLTATGGITGATSKISGAVPSLVYIDTDTADEDDSATILVNCTDTGTGTEDCDVTFQQQVAGVNENWLVADADGSVTIGSATQPTIISGDLTVNGTTTTINSTTLEVEDKNIVMGDVAVPDDTTADGGGVTLLGATDKSILWDNANDNWTSNQNWNIATGLDYKVNNVSVLNATTLGANVVSSSLTSVGTLAAVDIDGGNIDGVTMATSDITVGAGKTLDVSAGTLTLANDQISGDKVEGGTINATTITTLGSTTVNATTFDTNVAAAGVTLTGTTLQADGTDPDIDINLTPQGTGDIVTGADFNVSAGSIDFDIFDNFASALSFDTAGKTGILELVTLTGAEGVNMSGFANVTGTVTGGTLTDGVASINAGAISSITTIGASGTITTTGNTGLVVGDNTNQNLDILTADVLAGDYKLQWVTADGEFALTAPIIFMDYAVVAGDLEMEGNTVYVPSADQSLLAATQITVTNAIMRVVGNGGAVTLTGTPTIVDSVDGDCVKIQGTSDANTVKLQDEAQLANTGLQLSGGADFTLGQGDMIGLCYDLGDDKWYEVSRSDN